MGAPKGNQNGRKKNRMLGDALKRALTQDPNEIRDIAHTLIQHAKAGEAWAQNLIWERVDGKVAQPVGGDDELGPIQLSGMIKLVRPDDDG